MAPVVWHDNGWECSLNRAVSVWLYNRKLLSKYEMKSPVLWGIMSCCPLNVTQHFQRYMLPSLSESEHCCETFRSKIELYPYFTHSYSLKRGAGVIYQKNFCFIYVTHEPESLLISLQLLSYSGNSMPHVKHKDLFIILVDFRFSHSDVCEDMVFWGCNNI